MVAPLIVAGAISAAASLAETGIAANQGDSGSFSRERADTWLTRRVLDARNAGLHPLFALGAGGSSPTYTSGSNLGDGVARAGRAVAEGVRGFVADKRNTKLDDMAALESSARIGKLNAERKLDELQLMAGYSAIAIGATQAASGPRMNEDGSVVVPAQAVPGATDIPLPTDRPVRHEPRITTPKYTTYIDDDGDTRRIYHEGMQADELNQLLIAKHEGGKAWQSMKRWIISRGRRRGTRYKPRTHAGRRRAARERYYGRTNPRGY